MEDSTIDATDSLELLYRRRRASILHKEFKFDTDHAIQVFSQGGCQCFSDVWVMTSDLSGFTKTTKKWGVTHFTGIILRQHQIVAALINFFDPIAFVHEADNWTVLFNTGHSAMEAALSIRAVLARQNKIQSEQGFPEFSVKFGGIGISKGDVWTHVGNEEFFGNAISQAFVIGEDLAEKVIGLTEEAWEEIGSGNPNAKWRQRVDEGMKWVELIEWNKRIPVADTFELPKVSAHISDERFLMFTAMFSGSRTERDNRKNEIEKRFLTPGCVCIMFGLCWGRMFAVNSAPYVLNIRSRVNASIGSITTHNHGMWNVTAEGGFCVFQSHGIDENAQNALRTVFEIKEMIRSMANNKKIILETTGFGMHAGSLLCLPHSYICFGDPLNCASKIGEDVLEEGKIGLTYDCFDALKRRGMPTNEWEARTFTVSNVTIECYVFKR